jgi:hypothetical protein
MPHIPQSTNKLSAKYPHGTVQSVHGASTKFHLSPKILKEDWQVGTLLSFLPSGSWKSPYSQLCLDQISLMPPPFIAWF